MRVTTVGFYNIPHKLISSKQEMNSSQKCKVVSADTNSYTSSVNFTPFNVNFTSGKSRLLRLGRILTTSDLICPYSGKFMVPRHIFDRELTLETLEKNGGRIIRAPEAINVISQFEEHLHEIESKVLKRLKEESIAHPNMTLQDILIMLQPDSLKALQKKQIKTFNTINYLAQDLPENLKTKILQITEEARQKVQENNPEMVFLRKPFIADIVQLEEEFADKNQFKIICKAARSLDNSTNDVNAFIVKYSRRSSQEIGKRIVEPSIMTFEHIIPQSKYEKIKGTKEGMNEFPNGLLTTSGFNGKRQDIPFLDWLEKNPNVPNYCQRYIDSVITLINRKGLLEYRNYPRLVADTLRQESNGLIDLDISRLNLDVIKQRETKLAYLEQGQEANRKFNPILEPV